ncbi:MAG: hypothetical protein C0501_22175 [Isosphaera sp.]|nr:hypothetical protein [Isosphaera sp.]
MLVFFRCVAEAVAEKGVRGLAEMVPGGPYACEVAAAALKKYRDRRRDAEIRAEIQQLAQANFEEARRAGAEAAKAAVPDAPIEDRITLELFLSQAPGAARASQKRPDDPSGRSLPAAFALNTPDDVLKLLAGRPPRFKPGDPVPGLAGWSLVEPLGSGGFGEVWLSRHRTMASLCGAVKFCHGQQARDLKHESGLIDRVMAAGRHPNIVPLTNVCLEGEAPWLMYEYVPGGDLADVIRQWQKHAKERRVVQAVAALKQLAAAVAHFHHLTPPVVHRDLKPANILVDRANKHLRITDFGIGAAAAKAALLEESRRGMTHPGRLASYLRGSHTPLYSSPQQRAGADPDPRDDVHALGVIGYQLLTGRLDQAPGTDAADDLRDAEVPEDLIRLLGRCVAQNPERRPADAGELRRRLESLPAAAPMPTSANGPPSPPPPIPPVSPTTSPVQTGAPRNPTPAPDPPSGHVRTGPDLGAVVAEVLKPFRAKLWLYLAPDIPTAKLANAQRSCAFLLPPPWQPDGKVLGLIDITLFGSASDCLVFTRDGFHYHKYRSQPNPGRIPYTEFPERRFEKAWTSFISYGEGMYFEVGPSRNNVLELLNAVRDAIVKASMVQTPS